MSCWKGDPSDRPTVDYVLAALQSAAGEWKPKPGALVTLSPRDDWSPTLRERSNPPSVSEHEIEAPSAVPTTTGVQSQRTPGTPLTPDEMLDRILVRAKSPLGKDDAQKAVETLSR